MMTHDSNDYSMAIIDRNGHSIVGPEWQWLPLFSLHSLPSLLSASSPAHWSRIS